MNHSSNAVYTTLKNDKVLLNLVLQGMFVVARRLLGYSPRAASYPFMTSVSNPKYDQQFEAKRAHRIENGSIEFARADHPHKNHKKISAHAELDIMMVSIASASRGDKNGVICRAIRSAGVHAQDVDMNAVMKAIFDDLFDVVIRDARDNIVHQYN